MDMFTEQAKIMRAQFTDDSHRPQYHFLAPANWMNDPNGVIQWEGRYHLFYQYNPAGAYWGAIHWGHAVSSDLVHWEDWPLALAPTPGSADEAGCWSGCTVNNNGVPTLIYSGWRGGKYQSACVATSSDGLLTWQKHPGNPVIPTPPDGLNAVAFRDHSVWREDGWWYQVIGSGVRGKGGMALLYRSADLIQWAYLHPLCQGDTHQREPIWTGEMWECPQFWDFGERRVLVISVWNEDVLHYSAYLGGHYADQRFTADTSAKLDYGDSHFYAPQGLVDAQGRRMVWGWITEGRSREAQIEAGWSGVLSLPRLLTMRSDGLLGYAPVPELMTLRREHTRLSHVSQTAHGTTAEIVAEFEPAGVCGLVVRASPDGLEQTRIFYDPAAQRVGIDRTHSTINPDARRDVQVGPLSLAAGEHLRLHVFIDQSVIEVFANERACITSRVYPARADSDGLRPFGDGFIGADVWQMASIW